MPLRRVILALLAPLFIILAGTVGYNVIEGWSFFDSLYMTVITLTTVGYLEVHELSQAGRAFTMILALGGVFTLFYTATAVIRAIVSGEIREIVGRQRMERSLHDIKDHLIICGYGRMGRLVCQEFSNQGLAFVVIDRQKEAFESFAVQHGIPLHGDATSDEVLLKAGVQRARALVTVATSDADNLYVTMSARLLNTKLFIVARADDERAEQKLMRAGANRAVSPYVIGGVRVAQAVLKPTVVDFIELATRTQHMELQMEETRIENDSRLAGRSLVDSRVRQELGIIIVAIKKKAGQMVFNPPPEAVMEVGDILITLGRRQQLDELEKLAAAEN